MPRTIHDLVHTLELEAIEPDLFRGPAATTTMQRTYGGQVLSQAVVAAYQTAPEGRVMHSLHAHFLRPGRAEAPILYDVEAARDGAHFSTRHVTARQDGRRIFDLTCSLQAPEPGLEHGDPMPDVPAPDDCPAMVQVMADRYGPELAAFWSEWEELEVRYASADRGAAHAGHLQLWVRANGDLGDDPVRHQAVLAYLSDISILAVSLLPHGRTYGRDLVAASLDHAMWFHRPVRADGWLLYDQVSPSASGARGFSLGRLYSAGQLVATTAQEGLIRVISPETTEKG